jgi:hypothetical protein
VRGFVRLLTPSSSALMCSNCSRLISLGYTRLILYVMPIPVSLNNYSLSSLPQDLKRVLRETHRYNSPRFRCNRIIRIFASDSADVIALQLPKLRRVPLCCCFLNGYSKTLLKFASTARSIPLTSRHRHPPGAPATRRFGCLLGCLSCCPL